MEAVEQARKWGGPVNPLSADQLANHHAVCQLCKAYAIGMDMRDYAIARSAFADDALIFQDRITGMLDAHLTTASNRLNEVMKVLTVVATIFGPPTLIAGIWGMNVPLPHLPGGEDAQFWWVCGGMVLMIAGMLAAFRRKRWI